MAAKAPERIEEVRERLRAVREAPRELEPWCEHPTREVRKRRIADGRIQLFNQCLACGAPGANVSQQGVDLSELLWFDEQLQDRYSERRQGASAAERERRRGEMRAAYREYLASPEWREVRDLVMLRAQGICEGCRRRRASDVHHLSYEHVGEEFLWELRAVCRHCHERWHGQEFGE